MAPDSIEIICPSCALSRRVPLASFPSAPVKVTCPKCRNIFSFDGHVGMTAPPPERAPSPPDGALARPEPGPAENSAPGCSVVPRPANAHQELSIPCSSAAGAAGGSSCDTDIPQKYLDFIDDYNSGLDRASLCRKHNIPSEKLPSYLEFLKRKGLHLAGPAQMQPGPVSPPPENPEPAAEKKISGWKKSGLFDRIEDREGALKMVRDAAKAFYFLGGFQVLLGLFIMREMLADGIAVSILAFFLQKFASRVAAIFLLLINGASFVVTILNLAGLTSIGGKNIWLAVIIVIVSARAVEATFRLHGEYKHVAPAF